MIKDIPDFPTALATAKGELLGTTNAIPSNFQEATKIVSLALELLVISKNHKYGKENINRFKGQGIFMRLWDKIMRLENHLFKKADLGKEGPIDTWGDVAGYGVVGVLSELGWYNLPFSEE